MNPECIKLLVLQFAHCSECEEEISVRLLASWLFTWLISERRMALKAVLHHSSSRHADEKMGQFTPAGSGEVQPPG